MTREEKKLRRRQNLLMALCWLIVLAWVACLLCSTANAAWECQIEGVTTGQAVTGSIVWAWLLMCVIVWLDKPKVGKRR